jgi:hypothetical protein
MADLMQLDPIWFEMTAAASLAARKPRAGKPTLRFGKQACGKSESE